MQEKAAGRFDGARAAFARVLAISSLEHGRLGDLSQNFQTTYPGPRHLASLLLAAYDSIAGAAVTDPNVEYALNRLATAVAPEGAETEATTRFSIGRSLAAFTAISKPESVGSRRFPETPFRAYLCRGAVAEWRLET